MGVLPLRTSLNDSLLTTNIFSAVLSYQEIEDLMIEGRDTAGLLTDNFPCHVLLLFNNINPIFGTLKNNFGPQLCDNLFETDSFLFLAKF